MIVWAEKKLVIITPPKCGSSSLHSLLCHRLGAAYVMGPSLDGTVEKHTCVVPWQARSEGYTVLCLVRNPLTRALSLFDHAHRWEPQFAETFFCDFVRHTLMSGRWLFASPITAWLAHSNTSIDGVVKLESIQSWLRSIGIEHEMPKQNSSDVGPRTILPWAAADLENFGYSAEQASV